MPETVYTKGAAGEMPAIVDFINYVFSQAHVPHDFKALLPKVYADGAPAGQEAYHYLAKQDGKIVSCVACRPTELIFGENRLKCGYVGSVSVHPYHRGEGHMKKLMGNMLADAREKNLDMLILGGQRQRYGYFGFENAGFKLCFRVNKSNVRHALSGADASDVGIRPLTESDVPEAYALWEKQPMRAQRSRGGFFAELKSWKTAPEAILLSGTFVGYRAGSELLLTDEKYLPKVVKALVSTASDYSLNFFAFLHEKERIAGLKDLCENLSTEDVSMVNVLNWPKVLKTLIGFKHAFVRPVPDASFALDVEGDGAFIVTVKDGIAEVKTPEKAPDDAVKLTHMEAQRAFFGIAETYLDCGIPGDFTGLPFCMSGQDAF